MFTHYFELRAIPQIEIAETDVINQIMQSLHQILVKQSRQIGISFPRYASYKTIGPIIRLQGNAVDLDELQLAISQQPIINDYAVMLSVKPIPTQLKGYIRVSRVHSKGMSDLRRAQKRLTAQSKWSLEVQQRMIEKWGKPLNYPYLHLKSSSTGQKFMLFIKQQQIGQAQTGTFSCYGLSQSATVADF